MRFKWRPALFLVVLLALIGAVLVGCTGAGTQGWSGPVVDQGVLYMGTLDGKVIALDAAKGVNVWQPFVIQTSSGSSFGCSPAKVGAGLYSTPAISNDVLFVGDHEGKLYELSLNGLAQRWFFDTGDDLIGSPVVANGIVYVGSSYGWLYAVKLDNGLQAWKFKTGGKIWSTPVVVDGVVYIGSLDRRVYALNAADGTQVWTSPFVAAGAISATPVVSGDTIYVAANDSRFYALNKRDGTLKWVFKGDGWFWATPAVSGDMLYATSLKGTVYAIQDLGTQPVVKRQFDLKVGVSAPPLLANNELIVGDRKNAIHTFSLDGLPKSTVTFTSSIYAPMFADQTNLYVATRDHKIYSLDLGTKGIKWIFDTDQMTLVAR